MTRSLVGRGIAFVGLVAGLVALGLTLVPLGGGNVVGYADRGAVSFFLIATLAYASLLPAEVGRDTSGTAAGMIALGFFLYTPAVFGFNQLDQLGAAAWLGLCTVLVPVGAMVVRSDPHEQHAAPGPRAPAAGLADPMLALALLGVVLIAVGIWLPVVSGASSLWNASASGHALGLLLLLVVVLDAAALVGPLVSKADTRYAALMLAATTFGLVEAPFVQLAFNHLDTLGTGGWLTAIGGLLLLGGVILAPLAAARRAPAGAAAAQAR